MLSDFLDKFKGKTNKVPKQGVNNLIEAPHKKSNQQLRIKRSDGKVHQTEKQKKTKRKKQKNSPLGKQNKKPTHITHSTPDIRKVKQNSLAKNKQTLVVKQNKKPAQLIVNHKKQTLKLPKISKDKIINQQESIRQPEKRSYIHHQKNKRSMLTQSRQIRHQRGHNTIQSLLDEDALIQLRKLNEFEIIVQQMQIKRKQLQQQQELLQKSRHYRKNITIHI